MVMAIASSSKLTLDDLPASTTTTTTQTRPTSPRIVLKNFNTEAEGIIDETSGEASDMVNSKGKGRVPRSLNTTAEGLQPRQQIKRVLPARLRRAAGSGQDGVRDLEEMIVDWLDRYGESHVQVRCKPQGLMNAGSPSQALPDNLRITITSLPLDLVDPPTYTVEQGIHTEEVTVTPQAGPSKHAQGVIETPDWVMVRPGEDDEEEAREELHSRAALLSPTRRRRQPKGSEDVSHFPFFSSLYGLSKLRLVLDCLLIHLQHYEDTSDEYYIRVHKKYEAFEKRQRKDERDKLAFERYKMRTRIDLLRGMSVSAWSAVVWPVMAREDPLGRWDKGREKFKTEGVEWLRKRLAREGEEVLKRYDQLLPTDTKRSVSVPLVIHCVFC